MDDKIEIYLEVPGKSEPILKRYTLDQIMVLKNIASSQIELATALADAMEGVPETEKNKNANK